MCDDVKLQQLIVRCAQGVNDARIAEQLGVVKGPHTAWSQKHQPLIRQPVETYAWH